MGNETLFIYTGKPDDGSRSVGRNDSIKAATFSRFVLPFGYKIELCDIEEKDLFYQINPLSNLSFIKRGKHFTRETSFTLYERALWLDMCASWEKTGWGKEEITVTLRGADFTVGMLPPRIVLFEAGDDSDPDRLEKMSQQSDAQVMQSGFLMVDLYFPEKEKKPILDDLLMLNEYFRYFGMPYDDHAKYFKDFFGKVPSNYVVDGKEPLVTVADGTMDEFKCYFERWANLLELPIKSEGKFYRLFPETWAENSRKLSYNEKELSYNEKELSYNEKELSYHAERFGATNNWQIYADNRAYVWTAAFLKEGGKTLQKSFKPGETLLEAKDYGHWIKFLNVDNPLFDFHEKVFKSPESTHHEVSSFERDWADKRTYKRWEHNGSWYGYCYHSGVVLAPEPSDGEKYNYSFAPFSSYYFDASLLLFYIRISLFRFSKELTRVFQRGVECEKQRRESLREIRREFSKFTILYRFPMSSNQQQTLEMFELNRKYLDIDDFFNEIQHEIDNTHDFLESVEASRLSAAANNLAKFGIPLATGGLVAAVFGMSEAGFVDCICGVCTPWWDMSVKGAIVLFFVLISWVYFGRDGGEK